MDKEYNCSKDQENLNNSHDNSQDTSDDIQRIQQLEENIKSLEKEKASLIEQVNQIKLQAANAINDEKIKNKISTDKNNNQINRILEDIMKTYNESSRAIQYLNSKAKDEYKPIVMLIQTIQDRLEGIIESKKGHIIKPKTGEKVDTTKHTVVDTIKPEKSEQNQTISDVLSYGLSVNNKTLVGASVNMFMATE